MKKERPLAAPWARLRETTLLVEERADPIEGPRAIHAEYAARPGAVAIDAEGRHTRDNITVAKEVGSTRVTETSTTGGVVVREQEREVAGEAGNVDLNQMGMGHHADAFLFHEDRVN